MTKHDKKVFKNILELCTTSSPSFPLFPLLRCLFIYWLLFNWRLIKGQRSLNVSYSRILFWRCQSSSANQGNKDNCEWLMPCRKLYNNEKKKCSTPIKHICYILKLSLNKTSTVIGWFLVTCPWSNSNVSRPGYNCAVVARPPNTTAHDCLRESLNT